MVSLGTKVKQICAMIGNSDLSEWEADFISSVDGKTRGGEETRGLTEKQVGVIERIWSKHFA